MKKLMIGAAVAALCCSAVVGYCDVSSGNIVGFMSVELRKGVQIVEFKLAEVSTGEPYTLATLLPSALSGDKIIVKGRVISAKPDKEGKLHWMSKGTVVDGDPIPTGDVIVRYLRVQDKKTTLAMAGEVKSEWFEGGEELFMAPTLVAPAAKTPAK